MWFSMHCLLVCSSCSALGFADRLWNCSNLEVLFEVSGVYFLVCGSREVYYLQGLVHFHCQEARCTQHGEGFFKWGV